MFSDATIFSAIFQALLVSLLLTLVFAWLSIRLAWRLHLIDEPYSEPHKQHSQPVPQAGGIALAATMLLGAALSAYADSSFWAVFIAAIPIFLFGLWDDYHPLKPGVKLIGQLLSAILLIRTGIYIRIFESPEFIIFGTSAIYVYLDYLITILWIVGLANAFNFVDSMDGLVTGLGGMSAAFFMIITLEARQPSLAVDSALILGACIGLYFYNASPALLFLGDSGAQTLGFLLGAIAIAYTPHDVYQLSSWFVPILLLGVPIFDASLVILSRVRGKRPLFASARDHTYHRLWRFGLDPNRAVLLMQLASMILGCLAYLSLSQPPAVANLIFGLIIALGIIAIIYLEHQESH
jgi:UDP-GlcNAc:undecaprenyl-phosphate/decaprenyl-phosphate GlcNAc-1-phosphate transferase